MKISDLSLDLVNPANPRLQTLKANSELKGDEKKLMEACRDFEAVFMNEMLKSMRKTVPTSELTEKNLGQDIFQSMLDQEYASKIASTSSTGLAELMFNQLRENLTAKKEDE